MQNAQLRVVAIVVFGSAAVMFGASFLFDDPIRLVLRGAAMADILAGIVFWAKANREQRTASGE